MQPQDNCIKDMLFGRLVVHFPCQSFYYEEVLYNLHRFADIPDSLKSLNVTLNLTQLLLDINDAALIAA